MYDCRTLTDRRVTMLADRLGTLIRVPRRFFNVNMLLAETRNRSTALIHKLRTGTQMNRIHIGVSQLPKAQSIRRNYK